MRIFLNHPTGFLIIIGIVLIWHFSEAGITTASDIAVEDTTNTPPTKSFLSSEECFTSAGYPGKCTTFQECYPLTSIIHDDNTTQNTSPTPLEEEILEASRSNMCPNNDTNIICCGMVNFQLDEVSFSDEGSSTNVDFKVSDIPPTPATFPKDCGRSPLVSWRSVGGESISFSQKGHKVTGGRIAVHGQFPWMVAIFGKHGKITCGATLISNDFVLTAAHCLATYSPDDLKQLKLHIGDYNLMSLKDGPHELRRVSQIFVHKRFNSQTYHNDIALIKMDKRVNFTDRIQPICLPRGDTNLKEIEGKTVIVAGWGRTRSWGYESAILRMVEMPIWNLDECSRIYTYFAPNRIQDNMNFCAGDGKKNKDACIGDSGGPLMAEQENAISNQHTNSPLVQLGIVSWGKGCGSYPGVYTNLASFVPWIEKHILKNSKSPE